MARQMALIEHNLYKSIEFKECIGCRWTKRPDDAANVVTVIKRFNEGQCSRIRAVLVLRCAVSSWVATTVVCEEKTKNRAKIVSFFLSVATHCLELRNFSAAMQILSGLNNASVGRLK